MFRRDLAQADQRQMNDLNFGLVVGVQQLAENVGDLRHVLLVILADARQILDHLLAYLDLIVLAQVEQRVNGQLLEARKVLVEFADELRRQPLFGRRALDGVDYFEILGLILRAVRRPVAGRNEREEAGD